MFELIPHLTIPENLNCSKFELVLCLLSGVYRNEVYAM